MLTIKYVTNTCPGMMHNRS